MFFYPSCDSLITYLSVCNFQGGFDYKKAIVDTIIVIIEENSEAKEAGMYNKSYTSCCTHMWYWFVPCQLLRVCFIFRDLIQVSQRCGLAESFQSRVCSLGCLGLSCPLRNS